MNGSQVASATTSTTVGNRTLSSLLIGRSNTGTDPYLNMDVAYFYAFDSPHGRERVPLLAGSLGSPAPIASSPPARSASRRRSR